MTSSMQLHSYLGLISAISQIFAAYFCLVPENLVGYFIMAWLSSRRWQPVKAALGFMKSAIFKYLPFFVL